MQDDETERLDIRIPAKLKRSLGARAAVDRRTKTDVVILALEKYLEG